MVRGIEGNEMSTPKPSSQKKKQPASGSQSTVKTQKSILGFFQKKSTNSPSPAPSDPATIKKTSVSALSKKSLGKPGPELTPQPSSDPVLPSSPIGQEKDT